MAVWIVCALRAMGADDGEQVFVRVDVLHAGILAPLDPCLFRAARVQEHIVALVFLRPRPIGSGKVLAANERVDPVLFPADNPFGLQVGMNFRVDLGAGAVVGRDDQSVLGGLGILLRNRLNALGRVFYLMHPSLPLRDSCTRASPQ